MNTLTLDPEHQVNYLLDALPSHEWQALKSHVELVRLREEQILCDAGEHIEHAKYHTVKQSANRRGKQLFQLADTQGKQPVARSCPHR